MLNHELAIQQIYCGGGGGILPPKCRVKPTIYKSYMYFKLLWYEFLYILSNECDRINLQFVKFVYLKYLDQRMNCSIKTLYSVHRKFDLNYFWPVWPTFNFMSYFRYIKSDNGDQPDPVPNVFHNAEKCSVGANCNQ